MDAIGASAAHEMPGDACFLALGALRALLAADADDEPRDLGSLLGIVSRQLCMPAVGLLAADDLAWRASTGLPPEVHPLVADGQEEGDGLGLARRALEEQRILLLGRGSRDPRLMRLRELRRDLQVMALVPLHSAGREVGVLVLAAPDSAILSPPMLSRLGSVFSLLAVLVDVDAGMQAGSGSAAASPDEEIEAELEELRRNNREAEAALQQAQEAASSADAAGRAELETARARIAELDANLVRLEAELQDREERAAQTAEQGAAQEVEVAAQQAQRDERLQAAEARNAELEEEIERLNETIGLLESEVGEFEEVGAAAHTPADDLVDDPAAGTEFRLEDDEDQPLELGEIAAEAAAVLASADAGPADADGRAASLELELADGDGGDAQAALAEACAAQHGSHDPHDPVQPEELSLDDILEDGAAGEGGLSAATDVDTAAPLAAPDAASAGDACLWLAEPEGARTALGEELASAAGCGFRHAGTEEGGAPGLVAANLLSPDIAEFFADVRTHTALCRGVAYGCSGETGFELGTVGWVPRPLDAAAVIEGLRAGAKAPGSILLVSRHLREMAPLRDALGQAEIGGSVACDARQALDLLEIVQRPDAIIIDLDLEGCQGLGLASRLRTSAETESLPIHLIVPEEPDPKRLRDEAEAAGLLAPWGEADLRRLLGGALRSGV